MCALRFVEGARGRLEWVQESHYEITTREGGRRRHEVPGKFETKLMMSDAVLARFDDPGARICSSAIAFEHLRFVAAAHAAGPIRDVAPEHVRRLQASGQDWRQIAGIELAIDGALTSHRLWSEMDLPWCAGVSGAPPNGHASGASSPGAPHGLVPPKPEVGRPRAGAGSNPDPREPARGRSP